MVVGAGEVAGGSVAITRGTVVATTGVVTTGTVAFGTVTTATVTGTTVTGTTVTGSGVTGSGVTGGSVAVATIGAAPSVGHVGGTDTADAAGNCSGTAVAIAEVVPLDTYGSLGRAVTTGVTVDACGEFDPRTSFHASAHVTPISTVDTVTAMVLLANLMVSALE